jgi:hypothetical protein
LSSAVRPALHLPPPNMPPSQEYRFVQQALTIFLPPCGKRAEVFRCWQLALVCPSDLKQQHRTQVDSGQRD